MAGNAEAREATVEPESLQVKLQVKKFCAGAAAWFNAFPEENS